MTQHPSQPSQPLDAEERALAKSLPRLHGRTAPGPDLDASILAAAQAAVSPARPAQSAATPRIRWMAPAALAASMVLAVGMAWQLRPLPTLETAQSTAQSDTTDIVAVQMIEPAPSDKAAPMVQAKPASAQSTAPARQPDNPAIITAREHSPSAGAQPVQANAPPLPPATPASAPPSAHTLPAPPSPPAPPYPAAVMATEATPRTTSAAPSAAAEAAANGASINAQARNAASASADKASVATSAQQASAKAVVTQASNEAARAADAGFADDPDEDIPPATVDTPVVRDAWLQRIGELLEHGKRQEAKASLAEFRRRYPAAVLPSPLHALEIEP